MNSGQDTANTDCNHYFVAEQSDDLTVVYYCIHCGINAPEGSLISEWRGVDRSSKGHKPTPSYDSQRGVSAE